MPEHITRFDQAAIDTINRQLETFDLHQKKFAEQANKINVLEAKLLDLQNQKQTVGSNNLLITWTGGTLTLSWPAAYIHDRQGKLYPMSAGSRVVLASTDYWLAWNPSQQSMAVDPSLSKLGAISQLMTVCRVRTGTAGQAGTAGGGGSEASGVGQLGKEYINF